ncbi:MAG TPA: glycosyltransferase [Planctomycetota bacterium]|nr:glycosyltransferase [Planctomycetota bacterium]
MRVLMLTHSSDTPSTRHRILPLLPLFRRDGVDVEHLEIPSGLVDRWRILQRAPSFDIIVHQKRLLPAWQMRALKTHAKALVYDFDDPMVYARRGGAIALSSTRVARFRAAMAAADAVVCHAGSDALAREYGASRIVVIPTPVDLARWPMKTSWASSELTLGWLGTAANLPNLKEIAPALAGRKLRIVADASVDLPGVAVEYVKWNEANEAQEVRAFDVGIAPLPDDVWSRFKMPFKIVPYLASGVPVLATALGAVSAVIRDNENGLLAGDWKTQIARLEDPALRERLGRQGRRTAEADFTIEAAYSKWKALFRSLADRS